MREVASFPTSVVNFQSVNVSRQNSSDSAYLNREIQIMLACSSLSKGSWEGNTAFQGLRGLVALM